MSVKLPRRVPLGLAVIFILAAISLKEAQSAKILSVSVFSTKSHKITYEKILIELANRGHQVTYVGPLPSGKNITNLREVLAFSPEEFEKEQIIPNIFELRASPIFKLLKSLVNPFLLFGNSQEKLCRKFFQGPIVKELLNEKFDLVFLTPMFNECLLGLVHKLNTTSVFFTATQVLPWLSGDLGTPSCPSFVPILSFPFSDRMTFVERLQNFVTTIYFEMTLRLYYYPKLERIYRELIDPALPPASEIIKNVSLILANSHISLDRPRPHMPDIIEVGGLHMTPAKPLPKDLEEFFAGAGEDGVIYFSMGSAAKGSSMPESYRKVFLNAFSKLKQRVLWKWETEQMDGLPSNVKLSKWVPQTDILGDKRLRLFITHGGHGSTTEAIYHGVPLIGFPLMGDQPGNIIKAAKSGFAYPPLELIGLTEEVLLEAINTVLKDPSYRENARKLQRLYHDQPDKPLDRAIFWIEYVIRHQGATHLWSAARDLSFFQYFSLDILLTLIFVAVLTLGVNVLVLRAILIKLFASKGKNNKAKINKKTQ